MANFEQVKADIARATQRAAKANYLEAKVEFARECYPLLTAMLSAVEARVGALEDIVEEYLEPEGSFLETELAAGLSGTIAIGITLAEAVMALESLDDVTRKRLTDLAAKFRDAAQAALASINAVTEGEEDENEEDEGEEEEEEEETEASSEPPKEGA